eukprot:364775-Chlamydomonas_euryale.AAC.12
MIISTTHTFPYLLELAHSARDKVKVQQPGHRQRVGPVGRAAAADVTALQLNVLHHVAGGAAVNLRRRHEEGSGMGMRCVGGMYFLHTCQRAVRVSMMVWQKSDIGCKDMSAIPVTLLLYRL